MRRVAALAVAASVLASACSAPSRHATDRGELLPNEFVAAARSATQRYSSQDAAIADGFRRVGDDFPAMGEHWVSLPQVMADSFTPETPSVLTYIRVNGTPRLAGVAYTKLLAPNEQPPAFAPARGHWHEHNGSIVEESFLSGHDPIPAAGEPRLAILHAWIWIENPDGLFVTDNWALPFARLGIVMPRTADRDAARAAALATNAAPYYRDAIDAALMPTRPEQLAIDSTLTFYEQRAHRASVDSLRQLWPSLWRALEASLPGRASALREVRRRVSGM